MKNILITGGAGFVGRHFCRHFLEQGDTVYCVDPIVEQTGAIHPGDCWPLFDIHSYMKTFHYQKMDCRLYFKGGYDKVEFDYVIHLAAMVGGRKMIEENPLLIADDLSIDTALWQWALKYKPKKIAYFSSSAAYPIDLQAKKYHRSLKESDISLGDPVLGMPDMAYGWAKLTGEYLAKLAFEKYGIKSVVYRPFSGYGEDQDLAYPVPAICKRVIEHDNEKSKGRFQVWGSGYQRRDFIHISDVVGGVVKTIDQIDDASALNLSTGVGTDFIHLAQFAGDILKKQFHVESTTEDNPEGVFARVGDINKQLDFGIHPKVSLKEGLSRVVNHLLKND